MQRDLNNNPSEVAIMHEIADLNRLYPGMTSRWYFEQARLNLVNRNRGASTIQPQYMSQSSSGGGAIMRPVMDDSCFGGALQYKNIPIISKAYVNPNLFMEQIADICPICYEDFDLSKPNNIVAINNGEGAKPEFSNELNPIKCGHIFHCKCAKAIIDRNKLPTPICPICRKTIVSLCHPVIPPELKLALSMSLETPSDSRGSEPSPDEDRWEMYGLEKPSGSEPSPDEDPNQWYGGSLQRKTKKSKKSNKYNKRKSNKRKSNKRISNKRKSNKRKSNKKKSYN